MNTCVEIRSYNLKPGTRGAFDRLMHEQSLPMLHRWGVDVVAFGPSLHDEDSYYLIRAYPSLPARQSSQDAFYCSAEWREGPREALVSCIDTYTSVVLALDAAAFADCFRQTAAHA